MKTEKKAGIITEKIKGIVADKSQVIATYRVRDESVQAELRLSTSWTIRVPVDEIHYPKDLSAGTLESSHDLWREMRTIAGKIGEASLLVSRRLPEGHGDHIKKINERTKSGPALRSEAKNLWIIEAGNAFLSDYRSATSKRRLAEVRKTITYLQAAQKSLVLQLRESNSRYLAGKKKEREAQAAKNAEALKSGRFWEADEATLKAYFHPPFEKNYVADVSEKWRACLILECESVSYKSGYNNEWRHKLAGTGEAYLCGIDDNGNEWGHRCRVVLSRDSYDNGGFDATVEDAMSDLFNIRKSDLAKCRRQGDLLFCETTILKVDGPEHCEYCGESREKHYESSTDDGMKWLACIYRGNSDEYRPHVHRAPIMEPCEKWTPRESHDITSPSLQRNGRYFRASDPITVSHTSHAALTLPAGEYRLYALSIADAD